MRKLILALSLGASSLAQALVTVESDRVTPSPQGTQAELSAALDGRDGNTEREYFSAGLRLEHRIGDTTLLAAGEAQRSEVADRTIERSNWLRLGYRDELEADRFAIEAFADAREDDNQRLAHRYQLGAGARFTLDQVPDQRAIHAGLGALYEWEDQLGHETDYWRGNLYLSYKRQLSPQTRILLSSNYQPRLNQGSDFLWLNDLSVVVTAASRVEVILGMQHQHDSKAPSGFKDNDVRYSTGLRFKF